MSTLASFNTTSPVTYHRNGALSISGLSLVHPGSKSSLFNCDANSDIISLKHGSITGLVGVNGAGKTSLSRIVASKELPGFPQSITVEYLAASDDEEHYLGNYSSQDDYDDDDVTSTFLELNPIQYINARITQRTEGITSRIAELESNLESSEEQENDTVEEIANQLAEL